MVLRCLQKTPWLCFVDVATWCYESEKAGVFSAGTRAISSRGMGGMEQGSTKFVCVCDMFEQTGRPMFGASKIAPRNHGGFHFNVPSDKPCALYSKLTDRWWYKLTHEKVIYLGDSMIPAGK